MEKFVNEYEYNEGIIKESVQAWWTKKFKPCWIEMSVIIVGMTALFFLTRNALFLLFDFMAALVLIFSFTNQKKAVKVEQERTEVTHKGIAPTLQITVAEDIHMVSPQTERHFDFTSVVKILETKNLIVLLLKGNMNIPLSKTAFIEGTWEDCLSYLKTMTKQ